LGINYLVLSRCTLSDQKQMLLVKYFNTHLKVYYFRTFLGLVLANSDRLFTAVHQPPNGSSNFVFVDGLDDPIPARLDTLLGQ
jgi:hypothetical protein